MLMAFVFLVGVCLQNSVSIYVDTYNYKIGNFGNPGAVLFNLDVYDIECIIIQLRCMWYDLENIAPKICL